MTNRENYNKEKYKKAFSTLHASEQISLEVEIMEKKKSVYRLKKAAAACAAAAIVCGSMTVAYAADLGGIQQKITMWFHGKQQEIHVTDQGNGSYSYTYTDEDGEICERGGGGVAIDDSGNERPLNAQEVLEEAANGVEADANGKIWLYDQEIKTEITELFDQNGICRIALERPDGTVYYKIERGEEETGSFGYERSTEVPKDADSYVPVRP